MGRGLTRQRNRQRRRGAFVVLLFFRTGKAGPRCRRREYSGCPARRGPHAACRSLFAGLGSCELFKEAKTMSLHPIVDKAEVSVDFPDKAYIGSFGRHSQFDAYADADSVAVRLVRPGEDRREAVMHLHYGLLAEILAELARSLASRDLLDEQHRSELSEAARQLSASLEPRNNN